MNQDRDTLQHSIYHQEGGFPDIAGNNEKLDGGVCPVVVSLVDVK